MFYIHILAENGRIKNTGNETNRVLTPEEHARLTDKPGVKKRAYKQDCGRINIEVECLEINDQENAGKERSLAVPEFLIPGRRYPIYIYVFAMVTYCLNPWMGQREAAKRTRERFDLKTFSHTTLGRALKRLEKLIEDKKYDPQSEEDQCEAPDAIAGKFTTVEQTKNRRKKVSLYLQKAAAGDSSLKQEAAKLCKKPDYRKPPYKGAFIDACHSIVKYTFLKYHCFLL